MIRTIERKVGEDVSELMLEHAKRLRKVASQIEAGLTVAIAVVEVEVQNNENHCTSYFGCDRGRFVLVGGLTCLMQDIAQRINEDIDND